MRFAFLDMFSIRSEKDFYDVYAREVIKASSKKWEERMELVKSALKRVIPRFSIGSDPVNEFSVQLDWDDVEQFPEEILNLPEKLSEKRNMQMVVCIDEFQNINYLPDPIGFQKKIRATWQLFQSATFIIYGSRRHMLAEIFNQTSAPFFKFGALMHLGKIPEHFWIEFIRKHFEKTGKSIDISLCELIIARAQNHPATVQQLSQATWIMTNKVCDMEAVHEATEHLLLQMQPLFENVINNLTGSQINLLKAFVNRESEITSKATLSKYELGTSATALRARDALLQKEIVDFFGKEPMFEDPLFELWFSSNYCKA